MKPPACIPKLANCLHGVYDWENQESYEYYKRWEARSISVFIVFLVFPVFTAGDLPRSISIIRQAVIGSRKAAATRSWLSGAVCFTNHRTELHQTTERNYIKSPNEIASNHRIRLEIVPET